MPAIKRRAPQPPDERVIVRLTHQNHQVLLAYSTFLEESPDYVANQLVETVLARDKEFAAWRAEHPGEIAAVRRRGRRATKGGPAASAAPSPAPPPSTKAAAVAASSGGR